MIGGERRCTRPTLLRVCKISVVEVETVALAPGSHGDQLAIDALGPSRRSLTTLRALRARARSFDVVIAHGSTTLLACAVALPGSGVPFVYRQISDPLFWAATTSRRLRSKAFLSRAARVVSLSASTADVVSDHYGLPRSKIVVIPNAVPGDRFAPASEAERTAARAELGVDEDAVLAISVGALVPEKGVDLAIKSLAQRANGILLIAGDGPERGALEALDGTQLRRSSAFPRPGRLIRVRCTPLPTSSYFHPEEAIRCLPC